MTYKEFCTLTTQSISDKSSDGAEDDKYTWDVLCWTLCLLDRCCQRRETERERETLWSYFRLKSSQCVYTVQSMLTSVKHSILAVPEETDILKKYKNKLFQMETYNVHTAHCIFKPKTMSH